MTAAADRRFMQLALTIGRRGQGNSWPNPSVGAVIVKDDVIVGRGWTEPGGRPHAETQALKRAGNAARGATLYATLEPCSHHGKTPPCVNVIIAAGIARVVSAIEDPNPQVAGKGHALLRDAGIVVDIGVEAGQARHDHDGHIRRITTGRPRVTLKLAISDDGKAGRAGRRPLAITGETARAHVHLLRATHDAILIGIGTALADDPLLTSRLPGLLQRSPIRVVLDRDLRLPAGSALASGASETPVWVLCGPDAPQAREQALRHKGVDVLRLPTGESGVDLDAALQLLGGRGITRLMVEAGPIVAASFLRADLVDEAVLFRSPIVAGPDAIDALEGMPLTTLTQSPRLKLSGQTTIGSDVLETYERI